MEWMLLPFKRYAEFSGRSRRKEYWMFVLFNIIVITVMAALIFGVAGAGASFDEIDAGDPVGLYGSLFSGIGVVFLLYWLAVLIPGMAVSVRRLHDRGMSGWWYLGFIVASLIPIVGFIASIAFIVVMALPGTVGPNRYGPDPKGGVDAKAFA